MMIKNLYDLLRILLKQKSKSHVKRQKSKLLVYDIYLKKYVSADQLLVPSPAKDSIEGLDSWKKSKDFMLFDLLLKKFINPKLDLLSPPGANIKSKLWNCNSVQGIRYASTLKDFWEKGSGNNTGQVLPLPSTSKVGNEHVVGWAGQVISKPESNPRPEFSTSTTNEPSGNPEKNNRSPRSTPEKVKSKKYDKNSARNGALLYEGKSERKKRSILSKSLKPQKDVILQTKSKSKLWAKKYNIFNKSINALTKPKPENTEELFRLKPSKSEKETLFNKICSQMFSLRKTGGTDREDNSNKGSNLQKKDNINKDVKTLSQTNNSYNQESVFENNTSDSKLAKINKEYQKVSQNENTSKSERSAVESNTLENKLAKDVKEHHKVTQSVSRSQNEKPEEKNKTSETKLKTPLKEHNEVTHHLIKTKTETSVEKNNALENKLAKHVKEHHKVIQSLKSSQNKNPSVRNKIPKSKLAKDVNEHRKVTTNLSNSGTEKTRAISQSNLVTSAKDHQQVSQNVSSSKCEMFAVKTSEGKLENSVKEHHQVTQNLTSSHNEKPDLKNSISESTMANSLTEHHKITHNLSSSKSETFVVKNNTSVGNLEKSMKEHHKVTQNLSNFENEKTRVISKSNSEKRVKDHQQVVQNLTSSENERNRVISKSNFEKSVNDYQQIPQNLASSKNEKTEVISKSYLEKSVKDHQEVPQNLTSSKNEITEVISKSNLEKSVKDHQQVVKNLTSSENERNRVISKNNLEKSVNDYQQVPQNLTGSKNEKTEVISKSYLEKSVKDHQQVPQNLASYKNEKTEVISKSNLEKSVKDHQQVVQNLTSSENERNRVISKNNLEKSVNDYQQVPQNFTSSKNEKTEVISKSYLEKSVKDHQQVPQNLASYKNEKTEVISKSNLEKSVKDHQQVPQNLTSSKNEISEVISKSYLEKSVKCQPVLQNLKNSENEKTGVISKSNLAKSAEDHQEVAYNSTSSQDEKSGVTSKSNLVKSVKDHQQVPQNLTSSKNEITEVISKSNFEKSVKYQPVLQNLKNSENEKTGVMSKSNLAKSAEDHQEVAHNLNSQDEKSGVTSKSNLVKSVKDHQQVAQNLTSFEKTGAQNNTPDNKFAVKEREKVTHDLTSPKNTESPHKNANDVNRNANQIETKISEAIQDTVLNIKNESPPQKLKKENLNAIETSKNDLRQNNLNVSNKNGEVDSEKTDNKIFNTENKPKSLEKVNALHLDNNSREKYISNQNEKMSQEKYQPTKLKSLENVIFNFMCPPTPFKYKQTIYSTENKINPGGKHENYSLDQTPAKMTKSKKIIKVSSTSNLTTSNKDSSLIKSTEATQRGNLSNINIYEKVNPVKQLKNRSAASSLGNKLTISNSNRFQVQNKSQNTIPQTLQNDNIGNAVISGFEKPAEDTKATSLSQKKIFIKEEDGKNEASTMRIHNIEPKSTKKLHAISAQGKYLEDLALDGELNQYNIANYKGFKIVNSNSDTQVTNTNLPEQSKLKEGEGRTIGQSKSVDKPSEKPTDLQKSTQSKNSALHETKKEVTKKNLPEQSTPLGGRSIQGKYTDKTLGKPTALQKYTKLKDSALHEYKKQVTNNKVILQNKKLLDEKNKDVSSIRHILEVKNIKDQETIISNSPLNKKMGIDNAKVTKEIKENQLLITNTMDESMVKTKNVIEQNKPTAKENKGDKNTEESPSLLLLVNKKRNNFIKGNKFDHRLRLRRKLMKPIMFNYSIKKSRKFKNPPQQEETKNIDHRKKKESISLKLQGEKIKIQAKPGKKTKFLSKTSQLVSETNMNKQQRSKSVPVTIIKQGNEKHIIKSKSVETLPSSMKVSSGKQTKSLRQSTKVQSSKIKGPLSEVMYSSKHKSKFSNRALNSQIKKQSFQSLDRINFKAQDDARKGKITTKSSLPYVNPSNFNKALKMSTSQKGLDSLKINKRSSIQSQVGHLSKKTVAPKVSKMAVGIKSSPELSNQIESSKTRRRKQFDIKSPHKLSVSKPRPGSKANLNIELQNKRGQSISGRKTKVVRSKSEAESSSVSVTSNKNPTYDKENESVENKEDSEGTINVTKSEVITPKNRKEDLNSKTSSHSLKLVESNQPVNSTENHTHENKSREDDKLNKPAIKTKQSIINTRDKNMNYNTKREMKKMGFLDKVASNEIKDMAFSKDQTHSNTSTEAESFSVKELPQNMLNTSESKQEKKTERAETVVSITQKVPKTPASPNGSKYQDKSNLNNSSLIDTSREHKSEILTKGKNEKVNINSKISLSDSSFILPNIKNDVTNKSVALEKYLKKTVKKTEKNTEIKNEDGNIANINSSQIHKARFKSEKLSGKLDDEKVVYNIKSSKNDKINKYEENKQITVETKEPQQININTHDTSQQDVKDPVNKTERQTKQFHTSKVSNNKEQLSKNGNKTATLCSTQQNANIPKLLNKEQPNNEGNKPKAQYANTKQTENNPKTFNKKPVSESTKKLLNSTKQSVNTIQTKNNVKNNEGKIEPLNITKQIKNITKEAKKEPSNGINAPKVLNNMNQTSNTPKAVNKNSDNVTSNKTLVTKKINSKIVNYSHSRNENTNENSFIKHDSIEKKFNIENNSSEVKNKKSPVTITEGKVVAPIEIYKDVTAPQQKIGTDRSELKNNFILRNKINIKLKENSNNKLKTQTEYLTKLSSNKLTHVSKGNDENSLKNKQPLMQHSKIPANMPDNETHFSSGVKSKVGSISKADRHTNKEISNNLKEEENTKKDIGNNYRNPLSKLHNEIKHNVQIGSANKNITRTEPKGNNTDISRKEGEDSNINESSLIKDKTFDVSPDMRRKLSSAKLMKETKLSSSKSDHVLERQKSCPHDRTIEGISSKEQKVKQQDIKGKHDQFRQDFVQKVGFKNNITQNGVVIDNTNNVIKTEESEDNILLETKKTVCEKNQDSSEINESHFKTKDHTREKLILMLGNIKTGSNKKYINDNKEPIKHSSEIGKEENKVITLHKVQNGNKKEVKKPEPTTLSLKDKRINSNEQLFSAKQSEENSKLRHLSKSLSSLKTKELNDNVIKLDENLKVLPEGQNTTEKDVLKSNTNLQQIKKTDSIQSDTKINSTTQSDLLNLMDKNKIKTILRNEKADIKSTNKNKNNEVTSTKCDTSQINSNQRLKAPFVEDTPKKKGTTSLESFKNNKTSE